MAQWLGAPTTLAEDPSLVPETHVSSLPVTQAPGGLIPSFDLYRHRNSPPPLLPACLSAAVLSTMMVIDSN